MLTKEQAVIISAYTGYMMVSDFGEIHKAIEDKLGRPVWTHEMAQENVQEEIRKAFKGDFLKLCHTD